MPCATPCPNCESIGLPILFTRYAAAYSAQAEGIAELQKLRPTGQLQAQPGGVPLKTALYNLRMLRPGYLYVRIEYPGLSPEWSGYVVHPHGYLSAFEVGFPENRKANPACEVEIRGAIKSMVWVRDAKRVANLHYMFHPDPLDYEHLRNEIEPNRDKSMQRFDVAGWANGSKNQSDITQPGQLNGQVVEFAALTNAKLRDAIEPQMFGLMGANALERNWGDYEEEVSTRQTDALGNASGHEEINTEARKGLTYMAAHGPRLKKIAAHLQEKGGAVVACEDAIGITQELGHLQAEAQRIYTNWLAAASPGHHKDVSNNWVFQTAIGAHGLIDLAQKGVITQVEKQFGESSHIHVPLPRDAQAAAAEQARRIAARETNRKRELNQVSEAVKKYFDQTAADKIIATEQEQHQIAEKAKAKLGVDQVEWLTSKALEKSIKTFSDKDSHVGRLGGGASLTKELAQCMAGTASNAQGEIWLRSQEFVGRGPLARLLCFNSMTLQKTWQEVGQAKGPDTELPKAETSTERADAISDKGKLFAARAGLGDKALAFKDALHEARIAQSVASTLAAFADKVELADQAHAFLGKLKALSDSDALRHAAWPAHIASLMSVKMIQTINGLPGTKIETMIVRYVALGGLVSLGKNARSEAQRLKLPLTDQDALLQAERRIVNAGHAADASLRASNARASLLAALLDIGQAAIKSRQLAIKGDARTAVEMTGNLLQAIGSMADWRAKAYEETIYKDVKALDLSKVSAIEARAIDTLQELQLRKLRLTAFKFLLPAAVVSMFWDGMDGFLSKDRNQYGLATAQFASAIGSAFAISSTAMVISGAMFGVSASAWAVAAATLGLIGAVLTVAAVIAIWILKEDEWKNWLVDNPLNLERRGQKPIHKNLKDTLQQLSNAKAASVVI
jgi:hypothetical protein